MTVTAQAGKSGKEITISYTNTKVVGNGSFGVVFAAKTLREPLDSFEFSQAHALSAGKNEDGEDEGEQEIAIKKVLQDKRFKVSYPWSICNVAHPQARTENCKSCGW